MADRYSANFDLPTLLRIRDLEIRSFVEHNRSLLTGEYFSLLSDFISFAPRLAVALTKISALGGDENAFQCLADAKALLEGIGCNKYAFVIGEIIEAGKQDDKKLASGRAKGIADDLNRLSAQILAANRTEAKNATNAQDAEDPLYENPMLPYGTHSLKKILELLDREEATRKLRILAVDDAPVMLKIISSVLSEDYKVYGMANPKMIDKFLRQVTPELFLLDYMMPEINGFELIPIIRSFPEHKNTPIIFLTSLGTVDHISAAVALGACDFVVKPFQAEILREKIAKHIVRKRPY